MRATVSAKCKKAIFKALALSLIAAFIARIHLTTLHGTKSANCLAGHGGFAQKT